MESFTPKERSINFSNDEKERFQELIGKYKTFLFNKKTDQSNNLQKRKIWMTIHAEFNAMSTQPRSVKQLQAKFDNMKRNARKEAHKERKEIFKTGGGPPPPSAQPETEWFRRVMPISMDGLPSSVDDDFIEEIVINNNETMPATSENQTGNDQILEVADKSQLVLLEEIKEKQDTNETLEPLEKIIFDSKSPGSLLRTPIAKSLRPQRFLNETSDKRYNKERLELLRETREYERQLFEKRMQYYEQKMKQEKEINELKKRHLMLKISLLEK